MTIEDHGCERVALKARIVEALFTERDLPSYIYRLYVMSDRTNISPSYQN